MEVEFEQENYSISRLPDEALIHILSFLTVNEATKTSVLSIRWRYLWTHTTSLSFVIRDCGSRNIKYIDCVNRACSLIQSSNIEKFRIEYPCLDKRDKDTLDKWIKFAMEKKVKKLELILVDSRSWNRDRYKFTYPNVSLGFKHLKSFNIAYVTISDDCFQQILQDSLLLEQVSIEFSHDLRCVKVGVGGPLLNLKFLKLNYCHNLQHIEIISAPRLSHFDCLSGRIKLHIENAPSLVHVSINSLYRTTYGSNNFFWPLPSLSNQLFQLQPLVLSLGLPEMYEKFPQIINLSLLRKLTVKFSGHSYYNIFFVLSLLNATPYIETFRLEIEDNQDYKWFEEKDGLGHSALQQLKVLEIIGFVGVVRGVEFVKHLLNVSVKLESVFFNPIPPWDVSKYLGSRMAECYFPNSSRSRSMLIKIKGQPEN